MPPPFRIVVGIAALLALAASAQAEPVRLAEALPPAGQAVETTIALTVKGAMAVERAGQLDKLPLESSAEHRFAERADSPTRGLRLYSVAKSNSLTGFERAGRELGAARRLVLAEGDGLRPTVLSLGGPLMRDELSLVGEHFHTASLLALLPAQAVEVGASWPVAAGVAQALCQFEAVGEVKLNATLSKADATTSTVAVSGTAEGFESGAKVSAKVEAELTFDRAADRLSAVKWVQTDSRARGPASPASELVATVTLSRKLVPVPPELAAAKVPDPVPGVLSQLSYADPAGRYRFLYPRGWHVVGRTDQHLILRLVEQNEFVAQATITAWAKAAPGGHLSPVDFKKIVQNLPGWKPEGVTVEGELPADPAAPGRYGYRVGMVGTQDELRVVQTFYLVAAPGGEQLMVTVLAKPDQVARVGALDVGLVAALEFGAAR